MDVLRAMGNLGNSQTNTDIRPNRSCSIEPHAARSVSSPCGYIGVNTIQLPLQSVSLKKTLHFQELIVACAYMSWFLFHRDRVDATQARPDARNPCCVSTPQAVRFTHRVVCMTGEMLPFRVEEIWQQLRRVAWSYCM